MEKTDICILCSEIYEDSIRPRCLPCGHSYCTDCLNQVIVDGNISCPYCKQNHRVTNASEFPINFGLEANLSEVREQSRLALEAHSNVSFTQVQTLIDELKSVINGHVLATEDMQSRLAGYAEFLHDKQKSHEEMLQKIRDLNNWHVALIKEIKEERRKVKDKQMEGAEYNKEMNDSIPCLDNPRSWRTEGIAMGELSVRLQEMEEWIEYCRREFPYPKMNFSQKILKDSMAALSLVVPEKDEYVPVASGISNKDHTFIEKVTKLENDPTLTFEILQTTPGHWKNQIASGRLYAITSLHGRNRSAKFTELNGKIYLHYLQDRRARPFAHTIQHSEVVNSIDKDSTVAFMDLAWDGTIKGRIHILLSPDTPLARHFKVLCTGELGPSYARSRFHEACYSNEARECIKGGDYQCNAGTGGAPVMEGLNRIDDIYNRQWETGIVYVTPNVNDNQMAQFTITSGGGDAGQLQGVFGKVQDGLDVLKDAARFRNIQEVEIIDCGVVLPDL